MFKGEDGILYISYICNIVSNNIKKFTTPCLRVWSVQRYGHVCCFKIITISDFHCMISMTKRIQNHDIIVISIVNLKTIAMLSNKFFFTFFIVCFVFSLFFLANKLHSEYECRQVGSL